MDQADIERMEAENAKHRKEWEFRATILHDIELRTGTWAIDDEVQNVDLTEDALLAAVNARAPEKPFVTVGAPLHLVVARIIGYSPPYRHVMERAA